MTSLDRSPRRTCIALFAAAAAVMGTKTSPALAAATVASWVSPVSGSWTDPSKWSTAPNYPDNNGGATYDATIAANGSPYTVTLGTSVTIHILNLNSVDATFNQTDGTLSATSDIRLGNGVVNQSGGTVNTFGVSLGFQLGDNCTYNLSGGTLANSVLEFDVGSRGNGTFNQTGGTNAVDGLYLGLASSSFGVYNVSGATTLTLGYAYIGNAGTGTFNHTDAEGSGPRNHMEYLYIGNQGGSHGSYVLSGTGTLSINDYEYVGNVGSGRFTQSGSTTHTVGGDLYVSNTAASTGSYDLSGSALLTVNGDEFIGIGGHGSFTQSGGTHTVMGDVYLGGNPNFVSSGRYVLSGGSFTASTLYIGVTGSLSQTGGSASFANVVNYGNFTTSGGTMHVQTVSGDGTLVVPTGVTLHVTSFSQSSVQVAGTLIVDPSGGAAPVNSTDTLHIDPPNAAKLDLNDNDLIATATPLPSVAAYIASGYNGGSWTGPGLTSSSAQAAAASAHPTALGYATASSINTSTFDGQAVSGANVLVRYTYSGDANLDGFVNALDFNSLASNFGNATGKVWTQADFNYDGMTNTLDFNSIATNFNLALPSPSAFSRLVPEPVMTALVLFVLPMKRTRRRIEYRAAHSRPCF
jgi:hypothetical protein